MSTSRYGSTKKRRKMRTISRGMPGGPVCKAEAQDRPCLFGGQFDCGDLFGCVAAPQFGPPVGGAKIAHPIDNAVRRNQIAVVAVGKHDKRDVHRSPSLAAGNRQNGERSDPDASADERSHHGVVGSHKEADSIRFWHR